uniref:T-box domain-containing protein n=1 Tax=Heterorhabditis bacteriophora TaxID=37862 RepID=A0A1I7XGG5_HETBA
MNPDESYAVLLHLERVDDLRHKFSAGEWSTNGKGDAYFPLKRIPHHDGAVETGATWMSKVIAFDRVKVTNNPHDIDPFHVILQSMHKYVPVLHVYHMPNSIIWMDENIPAIDTCPLVARIKLDYTEFIAVTAYQNQSVTKLKIFYNPFAKGFRDGSERDRKRGSTSPQSLGSDQSPKASALENKQYLPTYGTLVTSDQFTQIPWYNYCPNTFYSTMFPYYYPYMQNCYSSSTPEC